MEPRRRAAASRIERRPAAGVTEWTLSNGVTVVLQPTSLKVDQILSGRWLPAALRSPATRIRRRARGRRCHQAERRRAVQRRRRSTRCSPAERPGCARSSARSPRAGRRRLPAGSRNAVPAHLSALHPTARRRRCFRRDGAQALALLPNQDASPEAAFTQTLGATLSATAPTASGNT